MRWGSTICIMASANAPLSEQGVTAVCDFIEQHGQGSSKVLVHCRQRTAGRGARAAPASQGQQLECIGSISKGKAMGLEVDGGLKMLVESYLNQSARGSEAPGNELEPW